ncbi:MAG: hypothetical protein AAF558_14655, partial [Verrucomicrobiota bacterium]
HVSAHFPNLKNNSFIGFLEAFSLRIHLPPLHKKALYRCQRTNEGIVFQIGEMCRDMEALSEQAEVDPARLQEIESRLDVIKTLKRKYGSSFDQIQQACSAMKVEQAELAGREERVEILRKESDELEQELSSLAENLRQSRSSVAAKLAEEITGQLQFLGFNQAHFEVRLAPLDKLQSRGYDRCEFFFAPNPGQSARPLKAVASSGEMARVMLAVKSVLAASDEVPILIFDEVDANVGGETAVAVGKRLRNLAGEHQVLCITHLPQVAAAGHVHYRVEKSVHEGRTQTQLAHLKNGEREVEISRMLGGKSESALGLAKNLIAEHAV